MRTMLRAWVQARGIYRKDVTFSPQLWQLTQIPEPQLWAVRGVVALKHVITDRGISSFACIYALSLISTTPCSSGPIPGTEYSGTFFKMAWQCPAICSYWESVVADLNVLCEWSLQLDPRMVLLGILEDIVASRHIKLFLFFAL